MGVKSKFPISSRPIWWTLILAPISQELIFRLIPYQFFFSHYRNYWAIGLVTSFAFALIHWYFGKLFVLASFLAGLFYWWLMVNFGLLTAVVGHSVVNFFWLASTHPKLAKDKV